MLLKRFEFATRGAVATYTQGECAYFAIACNSVFGWPIGVAHDREWSEWPGFTHAFNFVEKRVVDIHGVFESTDSIFELWPNVEEITLLTEPLHRIFCFSNLITPFEVAMQNSNPNCWAEAGERAEAYVLEHREEILSAVAAALGTKLAPV